ncbi:acyl-ACP thioesterase domain-containing protein [Corynebacterium argentoratense]|uniref:acyl-ACP thioesterase domain-containing protein n=1 Tax=Corynebacterium argentoratense TaxID=42817 RepID=UPI001F36A6A8|nr:acyl-ACP thioesterase domain-containing protein [Corynebacterium argentoratense]MCF1711246.1 thioesterase [Corynebacterium argentoratense]
MKIHALLELRWSDQDANHHVNNATIVTLLEEVRMRAPKDITDELRVVRTLEVRYDGELTF